MIENIPTHLIAGPLGAGKTTLLKHLLGQRPDHERWAILINEYGQIGMDAALLQTDADGVSLAEIPGGCLCCVNGLPFQVGLNRLLRKARPDRLFIEASGLGHPLRLQQQLADAPWRGLLALQPLVMVLDAPKLAQGVRLPEAQELALPEAGLIILNKAESLTSAARQALEAQLPSTRPNTKLWCEAFELRLDALPRRIPAAPQASAKLPEREQSNMRATLWRAIGDWHCHTQELDGHYSIGWHIHPDQQFELGPLESWLLAQHWLRAKGAVHTSEGWRTFNALPEGKLLWQKTQWHKDNRIELITAQSPDRQALEQGLRAAAISD